MFFHDTLPVLVSCFFCAKCLTSHITFRKWENENKFFKWKHEKAKLKSTFEKYLVNASRLPSSMYCQLKKRHRVFALEEVFFIGRNLTLKFMKDEILEGVERKLEIPKIFKKNNTSFSGLPVI